MWTAGCRRGEWLAIGVARIARVAGDRVRQVLTRLAALAGAGVKKAFSYYEKAIELDPKEPVYYHNFGTTVFLVIRIILFLVVRIIARITAVLVLRCIVVGTRFLAIGTGFFALGFAFRLAFRHNRHWIVFIHSQIHNF